MRSTILVTSVAAFLVGCDQKTDLRGTPSPSSGGLNVRYGDQSTTPFVGALLSEAVISERSGNKTTVRKRYLPFCTASLLCPNVIVSAGHCATGHEAESWQAPGDGSCIKVDYAQSSAAYFSTDPVLTNDRLSMEGLYKSAVPSKRLVKTWYNVPGSEAVESAYFERSDFVRLGVLDRPIELDAYPTVGLPSLDRQNCADSTKVVGYGHATNAVYPDTRNGRAEADRWRHGIRRESPGEASCLKTNGVWQTGAESCHGDSGGPLLAADESKILGVAWGGVLTKQNIGPTLKTAILHLVFGTEVPRGLTTCDGGTAFQSDTLYIDLNRIKEPIAAFLREHCHVD